MANELPGFILPIRCNATLGALVQFFRDRDGLLPFDFTDYSVFYSSAKETLLSPVELMRFTVTLSLVGLDVDGNEVAVTPLDGWLQFFADATETGKGQVLAETQKQGFYRSVLPNMDVLGVDSEGSRIPIGTGYAEFYPGTTDTFV